MQRNIDVETFVMAALILSQLYKVTGFMGIRYWVCMKITLDTYLCISMLKNMFWDVPSVIFKQVSDKMEHESHKYYNYNSPV